jgi:hypothetical protein
LADVAAVTERPGRCYLHVVRWPKDRKLFWYDVQKNQFSNAYLLADAKHTPLEVDVYPRSLLLHLPASAPDPFDSVVVLQLKGPQRWLSRNKK